MSQQVDLDALAPKKGSVVYAGETIEVNPPRVIDLFKLSSLGQELADINKLTEEQAEKLVVELNAILVRCIPQLAGKDLSAGQLMALLTMIVKMGMPSEEEEIDGHKVTVDEEKKDQ